MRQEHGHVAQGDEAGDRAQDDPGIAAVVGQVGQQAPAQPRQRAPLGDGAVFQVEPREQLLVALEQRLAQPEELDLLDGVVAGQQHLQVVQQAGFRRAAADGAKRALGVLGLREKGGDGGHEDDDRQPGAEPHQQDDQGDQRDDLLHHLQRGVDDVERAGVRLAPRVLQRIVEDGVFEELQVQADRLADDQAVDVIRQLRLEDAVEEAAHLARQRADQQQGELQRQVRRDVAEPGDRLHALARSRSRWHR